MTCRHFLLPWTLFLALTIAGCIEDVAAPPPSEEPFSMFGILNPRRSTQTMLVAPIERYLVDYAGKIDAVVTSTDMDTGTQTTWRDSVVTGERGQTDHIYVADFKPGFGRRYLVEARRSNGAVSSAEARVPEEVEIVVTGRQGDYANVRVCGQDFHLLSFDIVYTVHFFDGEQTTGISETYRFPYKSDLQPAADGYRFYIDLSFDHERIMRMFAAEHPFVWQPGTNGLALSGVRAEMLVAQPEWNPPGGVFDEMAVAQPGVMSNVRNGFGLVGAGFEQISPLFPPSELVDDTWFFDFISRPEADCDDCGCG